MIIQGQTDYKYHIKKALSKMQSVNKWQSNFILEIYLLFLSIIDQGLQVKVNGGSK